MAVRTGWMRNSRPLTIFRNGSDYRSIQTAMQYVHDHVPPVPETRAQRFRASRHDDIPVVGQSLPGFRMCSFTGLRRTRNEKRPRMRHPRAFAYLGDRVTDLLESGHQPIMVCMSRSTVRAIAAAHRAPGSRSNLVGWLACMKVSRVRVQALLRRARTLPAGFCRCKYFMKNNRTIFWSMRICCRCQAQTHAIDNPETGIGLDYLQHAGAAALRRRIAAAASQCLRGSWVGTRRVIRHHGGQG